MARPPDSSKWFLPLFSGTELVRRTPSLQDFGDLAPEVPFICMPPGLVLWLDRQEPGTVQVTADNRVYRWVDKSIEANHATQPTVAQRPLATATAVSFKE